MSGERVTIEVDEDVPIDAMLEKLNKEFNKLISSDQIIPQLFSETRTAPKITLKHGKVEIHKGTTSSGPVMPLFLSRDFLKRLGFTAEDYQFKLMHVMSGNSLLSSANSAPTLGTRSHLLFVYTDIIHDHFVGDSKSRLLKVVPITKGIYDNIGYMSITKPFYYPVRVNNLRSISILLADENGQQMQFTDGRTYLSLHFKRKELV